MSSDDWTDEVFDALFEGKHVLLTLGAPGDKRPIVMTVGRGTTATAEFSEEGIKVFSEERAEIVEVDEDGTKEVRQCSGTQPIGGSLNAPCQLDSGHSGECFYFTD